MFNCSVCRPSNPATDTVKVRMPNFEEQRAEEERRRLEEEEEEARLEEERRAAERRRVEEEARRRAIEREEEERRRREQAALQAQRQAEEEAARRRAEEEERERLRVVREDARCRERDAFVERFLKDHGYSTVTEPKKTFRKKTYALHKAAKLGDPQLVNFLLEKGAQREQKDSRGHTAGEVAERCDRAGSHASVVAILRQSAPQPRAGGA